MLCQISPKFRSLHEMSGLAGPGPFSKVEQTRMRVL